MPLAPDSPAISNCLRLGPSSSRGPDQSLQTAPTAPPTRHYARDCRVEITGHATDFRPSREHPIPVGFERRTQLKADRYRVLPAGTKIGGVTCYLNPIP